MSVKTMWVELKTGNQVWDNVKQSLAKYHVDKKYEGDIEIARHHYANERKCIAHIKELEVSVEIKIIILRMLKLRWEWTEAFEFAGYDEETKTYDDDYEPMGYLIKLKELFHEFKQIV